jgi:subfamily B ATP-binding cassette protein HlyB/CyaB
MMRDGENEAFRDLGIMHSSIKSFVLTAGQHGVALSADRLQHDYALGESEASDSLLVKIARENGLKARAVQFNWKDFKGLGGAFPVIARLKNEQCVIVTGYKPAPSDGEGEEHVLVMDPSTPTPKIETISKDKFLSHWDGALILLKREHRLTDDDIPFSIRWIVGRFLKQKLLLGELLLIAFILHLFAVLPAVFIMIVLDKVVNYQALSTLYVIASGVVVAYIFNGILGSFRQYIILFATSKVDIRLSAQVFSKLLDLPLSYFQSIPITDLTKTIQQTNTLRQMLTGKFFGAILDSTSLLLFIPILYLYSPILCAIVFLFSALISLNVFITSYVQKSRVGAAAAADKDREAIMMDTVSGIETIKSLALEPVQKREWEDAISNHIMANLELGKVNAITTQISSTLQQLMTVALIFVGVKLVFSGDMSAGVLIGVNMLAGRVTGPLVQLVSLATDFERLNIAVKMLGSIMNTSGEARRKGLVPDIFGGIEFKGVTFKYGDDVPPALDNVSFKIQPRQRVGIIGRAGAGQTTLARHIQGLLRPNAGTITIDDQDIRSLDLGHLRVNVAAVSQDSGFFRGSIRENIMKPSPKATMARVLWASRLVGLHEDVEALSDGYETVLVEGATNLAETMRGKVAMARALIRNPKILILDQAFIGFDMASEISIRKKMSDISRGRTLIVIASRVSQLLDSDIILVMDKGKIVQSGTHKDLVVSQGLYKDLWGLEEVLVGTSFSSIP